MGSDSLLTVLRDDGTREAKEWERSKIVPIEKLRAAVSYWGLAAYGNWSTYDWLASRAREATKFGALREFAVALRGDLEKELSGFHPKNPIDLGIGIHLMGYEQFEGYWIPELFLCSNFTNVDYANVDVLGLSRETFHMISGLAKEDVENPVHRHEVRDWLETTGAFITYNNGDPLMFNPAANCILDLLGQLGERGNLRNPDDIETYRSMATRPVEIVSKVQSDLCKDGTQVVGGRTHDLVITPNGTFSSKSGDDKL